MNNIYENGVICSQCHGLILIKCNLCNGYGRKVIYVNKKQIYTYCEKCGGSGKFRCKHSPS